MVWEICHGAGCSIGSDGQDACCAPKNSTYGELRHCPIAPPKFGLLISVSRGKGQGGEELTFVIVVFFFPLMSRVRVLTLSVWRYMAKSLFLLILS